MNSFVPWDISYLNRFFEFVKSGIGSAVVIGAMIFAIVFSFFLIRFIIRRFL